MLVFGVPSDSAKETDVVLTEDELIAALQKEVRILLHLTSTIDRAQLDYRPSAKQRRTLELLRYLYFKACGREALTTANLWAGVDRQPA